MKDRPAERVAVISDGTCDTAENYVRALLAQFKRQNAEIVRFPKIRHEAELLRSLDTLKPPYLIVYTMAKEELRKLIWAEGRKRGLITIDIFYPAIDVFSQFLRSSPSQETGALHSTRSIHYFDRVEAVEFTVKHDDGLRMQDIFQADLVLTGVSRTSKTPTSMYLANKGYRVANVPLVYGIDPPDLLLKAHEKKIPVVMLTIEAGYLEKIRRSRVTRLGTTSAQSDTYVDLRRISEELEASLVLARRHRWPIIDVTSKAVEETATEILLLLRSKSP